MRPIVNIIEASSDVKMKKYEFSVQKNCWDFWLPDVKMYAVITKTKQNSSHNQGE